MSTSFSSCPIESPRKGLLSMHPFVDVLEGRSFLCATLNDGVFSVLSDEEIAEASAVEADAGLDDEALWEVLDAEERLAPALLLSDGAPAEVRADAGASDAVFCGDLIDDSAETLFGNAFHNRRGVRPLAPPPPTVVEEPADQEETPSSAGSVFRTGRALTGVMRPFVVMSIDDDRPFAA